MSDLTTIPVEHDQADRIRHIAAELGLAEGRRMTLREVVARMLDLWQAVQVGPPDQPARET